MITAPLPADEAGRLSALRSYDILDTEADSAFDHIAGFAATLLNAPIAAVSLVDAQRQWFKSHHGLATTQTPRDISFCAHAILNPAELLVVPDATRDVRFADNPLVTSDPYIRFYAGVPLVNPQRHALGTLCVMDRRPREITAHERECLIRLGETVSTTLELRRMMNEVRHLALTDALTGIANRPAFLNMLDRAIVSQRANGQAIALVYFDLDGFKQVNDLHGHTAGDRALQEVGRVLSRDLRDADIVARMGGDEFVALLAGGRFDGPAIGERLRSSIGAAMDAAGWPISASVGVVTFAVPPDNAAAAIAAADGLMYAAKVSGKDQVCHRLYSRQ